MDPSVSMAAEFAALFVLAAEEAFSLAAAEDAEEELPEEDSAELGASWQPVMVNARQEARTAAAVAFKMGEAMHRAFIGEEAPSWDEYAMHPFSDSTRVYSNTQIE